MKLFSEPKACKAFYSAEGMQSFLVSWSYAKLFSEWKVYEAFQWVEGIQSF